jgi:hypothetical protein
MIEGARRYVAGGVATMINLNIVQQQVPDLDIARLKDCGLVVIYDRVDGMPGAAAVRQIVNVIVATHPRGEELYEGDLASETDTSGPGSADKGMTFLVNIPGIRLIPSTSAEAQTACEEYAGAVIDLRPAQVA